MIFGVVEISLDAGKQRRLVVSNATGGRLAIHEPGVAARALYLVRVALPSQPNGDDASVGVPVLHSRVLGHEDGAHGLAC
jgi:hypothetical protein